MGRLRAQLRPQASMSTPRQAARPRPDFEPSGLPISRSLELNAMRSMLLSGEQLCVAEHVH